jgi:hypothetical protein
MKPEKYFCRKLDEIHIQQKNCINATAVSSKTLSASYQMSCRIAQNKKLNTIAETAILPTVIDLIQTIIIIVIL